MFFSAICKIVVPWVFNGHELTVGNETMIGFVSETRGVDGYVGTLVGQVDGRRVVGVLPIDVNLQIVN